MRHLGYVRECVGKPDVSTSMVDLILECQNLGSKRVAFRKPKFAVTLSSLPEGVVDAAAVAVSPFACTDAKPGPSPVFDQLAVPVLSADEPILLVKVLKGSALVGYASFPAQRLASLDSGESFTVPLENKVHAKSEQLLAENPSLVTLTVSQNHGIRSLRSSQLLVEMVTRAAKHLLRSNLREACRLRSEPKDAVCSFFNLLFHVHPDAESFWSVTLPVAIKSRFGDKAISDGEAGHLYQLCHDHLGKITFSLCSTTGLKLSADAVNHQGQCKRQLVRNDIADMTVRWKSLNYLEELILADLLEKARGRNDADALLAIVVDIAQLASRTNSGPWVWLLQLVAHEEVGRLHEPGASLTSALFQLRLRWDGVQRNPKLFTEQFSAAWEVLCPFWAARNEALFVSVLVDELKSDYKGYLDALFSVLSPAEFCTSSKSRTRLQEASAKLPRANAQPIQEVQTLTLAELSEKDRNDGVERTVKVLLLGPGDSGKTCLFKQLEDVFGVGYSTEERKNYVDIIRINITRNVQVLHEMLDNFLESNETSEKYRWIEDLRGNEYFLDVNQVTQFWNDPDVQAVFERRSEYYLESNAGYCLESNCQYFMNKLSEVFSADYLPSINDILHARVRTTGIQERNFSIDGMQFKVFDVGGQRNERKKWIRCFDDVNCVFFAASLAGYNRVLYEDRSKNRLDEAIELYGELVNRHLSNSTFILFLTKVDLFKEQLKTTPLSNWNPDYEGDNSFEETTAFIKQQFFAQHGDNRPEFFAHCITTTDVKMFTSVMFDIVANGLLNKSASLE